MDVINYPHTLEGMLHMTNEVGDWAKEQRPILQEIKRLKNQLKEVNRKYAEVPCHWHSPIKRNTKEQLTKEEIDWRHAQLKENRETFKE